MEGITIDQLVDNAPDVINRSTLNHIRTVFGLAKRQAEKCSIGEMIDALLFVGQGIDDVVDEMAYAFQKGRIESADYDDYVLKIESFQWKTVPKVVGNALVENCGCKRR